MKKPISREMLAWASYDWANSAFSTTVITALFPIFFKAHWSKGSDVAMSTAQLGFSHSIVSFVLALLAPVFGALADRGSGKKLMLFTFTFLGIIGTALFPAVAAGDWPTAILLFMVANIGFMGANTFYDALLCNVATKDKLEFVSAFGFALGYLGGGLLFLFNVVTITKPEWFGFADKTQATRFAFFSVAVWWAIFSIPTFLFVPENRPGAKAREKAPFGQVIRAGAMQLWKTLHELRKHKYLGLFLLAYFFYIDGVNTIIKMSVDYGMAIGFKPEGLILAILIVQFVGFPATLVFGWVAGKIGAKRSLFICISVYTMGTVWAYFMTKEYEFYVLAVMIGLVQGGIQSISRAVFARMIPQDQSGEFFGFYNMLGKFSAVLGPLLIAVVSLISRDPRDAILSVIVLFLIGAAILVKVPVAEPQES